MESMGVLKDELLAAEEKEIGGQQIPYIAQGEMLVVGGRMGGYMPTNIWVLNWREENEVDNVGNLRLAIKWTINGNF